MARSRVSSRAVVEKAEFLAGLASIEELPASHHLDGGFVEQRQLAADPVAQAAQGGQRASHGHRHRLRRRLAEQLGDAPGQVGHFQVVPGQQVALADTPALKGHQRAAPGFGGIDDVTLAGDVVGHLAIADGGDHASGGRADVQFAEYHAGDPDHHRQAVARLLPACSSSAHLHST